MEAQPVVHMPRMWQNCWHSTYITRLGIGLFIKHHLCRDDTDIANSIRWVTMTTAKLNSGSPGHAEYSEIELPWLAVSEFLERSGYLLRPRYRKGRIPSWKLPENIGTYSGIEEDNIRLPDTWGMGIDAIQLSTNRMVWIVRKDAHDVDVEAFKILHTPSSPEDHIVPVLDVLQQDEDDSLRYFVLPFLRPFDDPPFETVGDAIDYVDQIMEGLNYMHKAEIANCDWSPRHIMMDAGALFPEGFHPVKIWMDPTGAHRAQQLPRQQGKVKYYFTDVQYEIPYKDLLYMPPDDKKSVMDRAKHHDPEILDHIHFSAFTSDLWNIGRLLRVQLYDKYANVGFLESVVSCMDENHPEDTLETEHCFLVWHSTRPENLTSFALSCRLKRRSELWIEALVFDIVQLLVHASRLARSFILWMNEWHG